MKINTNQNLTNLNTVKKVKTGAAEGLPKESVTLGQTEKFDDMKALKDMAKELGNVKASPESELFHTLKGAALLFGIPAAIIGAVGGGIGYAVGGGMGAAIGAGVGATATIGGIVYLGSELSKLE